MHKLLQRLLLTQAHACLLPLLFLIFVPRLHALNEIVVEDIHGRRLNEKGMTLVDWEGQIANPAIKVFIRPPSDATFPSTVVISAMQPRLYFDLPSNATATGPNKTFSFLNANPVPIMVSIFPDRDGQDEDYTLSITVTSAGSQRTQNLGVHVIDQDQPQRALDYSITVDYTKDATGFFSDAAKRAIVDQNARDWAYFFGGAQTDLVSVGAEPTFIWNPDGFISGNTTTNTAAYRGYMLYAYGISAAGPTFRSGGEPSFTGGFQSVNGVALPLKRSGGMEVEIKGNYNTLGWFLSTGPDDWWRTNFSADQNDLLSITLHEMGHALIFNAGHTRFASFKTAGKVNDVAVLAYHGQAPAVDASDHLDGAIDRLSGKGAFGYEYYGTVPARRWMITKLSLLVAQATGYTLRATSAFSPLTLTTSALPSAAVGVAYTQTLAATGGIPFYKWSVQSGSLPPGLTLDSFTGALAGQPTTLGNYSFTIEVAEYDSQTAPVSRAFSINVGTTIQAPRLSNVAVRTTLAANQILTVGLTMQGGPKSALIRAAGPGLGALGVPGTMADPKLAVFNGSTQVAANDNWAGNAGVKAAMSAVGAFPFASDISLDAALVTDIDGGRTVQVSGPAAGNLIVEVYDAGSGDIPRLTNISALNRVGTGDDILIAGFTLAGSGTRTLLIRAVGPSLGALGVPGTLADPKLQLFNSAQTKIDENDTYAASLAPTFAAVGAFALTPGAKDAALVVTLPAGGYTVQVSGADGGTGSAIVEIYELP